MDIFNFNFCNIFKSINYSEHCLLTGCFNLDPNRVLDIILESFEARPQLDKLFIPLIKNYMGDPQVISEVLGFKLGNMEVLESYKEPPALMTVIALLLQHQVISLDDIYPWVCLLIMKFHCVLKIYFVIH